MEHPVSTGALGSDRVLLVTAGARMCAIPLGYVAETMRPLPIQAIAPTAEMLAFVRGVSIIRGAPVPVIDLKALLDGQQCDATYGRFVTLKLAKHRAALAVDGVVGLRALDPAQLEALPPILGSVGSTLIEAIGVCEAELLVVLRAARAVPEEVWAALATAEATQ